MDPTPIENIEYILYNKPVTITTIIIQIIIFLYIFNYNITYDKVGYIYSRVVNNNEYYRIYTSSYTHLNLLHIGFNIISLWQLSDLEIYLSSLTYIIYTLILLNASMLLLTIIYYILIHIGYEQYKDTTSVGYSAVIFGLMSIQSSIIGYNTTYNLYNIIDIPYILTPFVSLLITQLLITNASFIGHLSGILVGYIIGFNLFQWINNIVGFIILLITTLFILIISLYKTNNNIYIPVISTLINIYNDYKQKQQQQQNSNITIVNGNIVYRSINNNDDNV